LKRPYPGRGFDLIKPPDELLWPEDGSVENIESIDSPHGSSRKGLELSQIGE
jgi:hypothetical protein